MAPVTALPSQAAVFLDARGAERALRVSWHHEAGVVVLSLWRSDSCVGTFRVPVAEVPALMAVLGDGLAAATAGSDPVAAVPCQGAAPHLPLTSGYAVAPHMTGDLSG